MDIAADMIAGQAGVEQLEKARKVSDKVEDRLEQLARPIKPFLPGIGRFLIVVTFLEDALRILTQLGGELPFFLLSLFSTSLTKFPVQIKTTTSKSTAASPGVSRTSSFGSTSSFVFPFLQSCRLPSSY